MSTLVALAESRGGVLESNTWVPAAELASSATTLGAELTDKLLAFKEQGKNAGPSIALFLDPSIAYVTALLAALEARVVFVPIDPSWPPAKIHQLVKACTPHLIITIRALLPRLDEALHSARPEVEGSSGRGPNGVRGQISSEAEYKLEQGFGGHLLVARGVGRANRDGSGQWPLPVQKKDRQAHADTSSPALVRDQTPLELPGHPACCYVLFTSGSTGQPKGVCGTWQGLHNRLHWMAQAYPYQEDDVACFKTAVGFVDHLTELLGPLLAGARVVIPPAQELRTDPLALLAYLEEHCVTRLVAVPSLLRMMLLPLEERARAGRTSSLRAVVSSGEALPWELATRLQAALPRTTLLNLYGSTEVTGDVLFLDITRHLEASAPPAGGLVPIGRPILHHDAMLLDEHQEAVQAEHEMGELCVAGPGLCCGYLGDPAATQAAFFCWPPAPREDGVSAAARVSAPQQVYYRTGDLAHRLSDGTFVWLGRKDRQVKVRGHRVQLEEVEAAFLSCALVSSAAVKAWPLPRQQLTLAAYVVLHPPLLLPEEQQTALEAVRHHVRSRLTEAANPSWCVAVAHLPLTRSGKVDHAALPPPRSLGPLPTDSASVTPLGPDVLEGAVHLAAVLQASARVLGTGQLESETDFFMAGGSSVTAAELAHLLGVDMRWVYVHRTPQRMAAALQERGTVSIGPAEPAEGSVLHSGRRPIQPGGHAAEVQGTGEEVGQEHAARLAGSENDVVMWNSDDEDVVLTAVWSKPRHARGKGLSPVPTTGAVSEGPRPIPWPPLLGAAVASCAQCSVGGELEGLLQGQAAVWATRGNHVGVLGGREAAARGSGAPVRRALPVLHSWALSSSTQVSLHCTWASSLGQCVDASALLLASRHPVPRLFIGSHAHLFACLEAVTGACVWAREVGGRVEATAALTADGAHVVFGCYDGCIHVLDAAEGSTTWSFRTGAEVKCQAVVDPWAGYVWCGSHDHCLYVLHVAARECLLAHNCGGSVYGAPAFDAARGQAYVVTTGGHVVAFDGHSLQVVWRRTLLSPLFASPAVAPTGALLCCSVGGHVTALSPVGAVVWHITAGGPIFAAPCLSLALPGQALICTRDGHVLGLDISSGAVLWDLEPETPLVGEPITASAVVDETVVLQCPGPNHAARLVWVCGSQGTVRAVAVDDQAADAAENVQGRGSHTDGDPGSRQPRQYEQLQNGAHKRQHHCGSVDGVGPPAMRPWSLPRVLAVGKLAGDVFSSPVAVGGSVYVGCRDDHVYKLHLAVDQQ